MRLVNHHFRDEAGLAAFCEQEGIVDHEGLLIQVFCGNLEESFIRELNRLLGARFPRAAILGTTTGGEIADGRLYEEGVIVSFLSLERTRLRRASLKWQGADSFLLGKRLGELFAGEGERPQLLLAVATGLNTNGEDFVEGVAEALPGVRLAGGLAGEYLRFRETWIFDGHEVLTQGVIAVALCNPDLQVQMLYSMDWMPLGRALEVERARKNLLIELDGRPTLETYRHYLGEEGAERMVRLSVQFPLMVERGGIKLARACLDVREDGSMVFMGNFRPGEKAWFAIGDPTALLDSSSSLLQKLRSQGFEAILTYTCVARKTLMPQIIEDEARVFHEIAPTAGFFTYGEFFHLRGSNLFFNYTLTLVALSERRLTAGAEYPPVSLSMARMSTEVRAYAHLINTTARELEEMIDRMRRQALTDELTQLPNRRHLMERLESEVSRHDRHGGNLAVLLMDLDDFKQVNDLHGHQTGDEVLRELARVIESVIRLSDIAGRWGGEEFLVICPGTDACGAYELGERLRRVVERHRFPRDLSLTLSAGCADHGQGEGVDHLVARADRALYAAKSAGKNRVCGCREIECGR